MLKFLKRDKSEKPQTTKWEAFEAEALPYTDDLFRLAMWLHRDRARAEDLVQETFVQALKSFHGYEAGTNIRAWLVTIMYRTRGKQLRADSRLQLVSDTEERIAETTAYEAPTPQDITDEEVLRALQHLPQNYQEVVLLADVEELSYKEIAEALSVPIGTVMSRLSRGRKMLRVELVNYANASGIGRGKSAV